MMKKTEEKPTCLGSLECCVIQGARAETPYEKGKCPWYSSCEAKFEDWFAKLKHPPWAKLKGS